MRIWTEVSTWYKTILLFISWVYKLQCGVSDNIQICIVYIHLLLWNICILTTLHYHELLDCLSLLSLVIRSRVHSYVCQLTPGSEHLEQSLVIKSVSQLYAIKQVHYRDRRTQSFFNTRKERTSIYCICRIYKNAQIIKNFSGSAFHKINILLRVNNSQN